MIRQTQQSMTARDICRILFRYRWRSGLFFIAVVVLAVGAVLLTPKKFQSEATFYMKPDFRVDPTATNETQVVAFDPEREGEMRSIVAMLESRILFEQVVDELGTDAVFEKDLHQTPVDLAISYVTAMIPELTPPSQQEEREKAIRLLMKSIKITHAKKSHVIVVAYKSRAAKRAQEVLTAYTSAAIKQHLDAHRNSDSYGFFVEQETLLKQCVLDATQIVRDTKNNYEIVSIESQRKVLEDHFTNLDKEILTTNTSLASAEDNVELLRNQLPETMRAQVAGNALSVYAIDTMRNQLYTLELRYRELKSRFQPNHPQVVATKEQLDEAILVLDRQQLINELSNLAALNSKRTALQHEYNATKGKLNQLNEQEVSIAAAERKAGQAVASHQLVSRKLEQARIDRQLESGNISNLRMTQAPTLMGKALSRKGMLIVSLSLIVGVLGALALAYVSDLLDESLGTASDVETSLDVSVLASLPRIHSHRISLN
jgi:uncharacterized protein involved in exopolysaccharide biosynthesis